MDSPLHGRAELSGVNRTVAAILAVIWIVAGVLAAILGVVQHRWLALLLSPLAVFYGLLWVRVARTGRQLRATSLPVLEKRLRDRYPGIRIAAAKAVRAIRARHPEKRGPSGR